MADTMIIDGHAHIYNDSIARKVIDSFTQYHKMEPTASVGEGTVSDILQKMRISHISYTVMANFAPVRSIMKTNEWTLSVAKENPELIPLVSVHPDMPLETVKLFFESGAKGIKMHNGIQGFEPTDKGLSDIYECCEQNRIPVTFHCGETSRVHMNNFTDISHILPVLQSYPGIPFVLTHLAAGDPDEVLRIAQSCPNAVFDTSITLTGEKCIYRIHDDFWEDDHNASALFREIGCDRITFGSDYPFGNPSSDVKRILSLPLSDEEKCKILGMNTYKLYF